MAGEPITEESKQNDPTQSSPIDTTTITINKNQTTEVYSPEMMKLYYTHLFPSSLLFTWLSYNNAESIINREFSFTLQGDIYIRYCSFSTRDEFKDALIKKLPEKIDIGAIFNTSPTQHNTVTNFIPLSKELIFDIDMTDYNDVRKCCTAANVCEHCWLYMTAALKLLDTVLRDDFGFQHILWIYSGRRGIHAWICDDRARCLNNDMRTAIVDYLTVYIATKGNDTNKVQISTPIHSMLHTAYDILEPYYNQVIQRQRLLDSAGCKALLQQLDEKLAVELNDVLTADDTNDYANIHLDRFEQLKKKLQQILAKNNNRTKKSNQTLDYVNSAKTAAHKAVFSTVYPRLDANVSKQLNHLLKSPFCVHPKTGRVCVPIDPAHCDTFDPINSAPTLSQLCDELGSADKQQGKYWQQTSMRPHIEYFQKFVQNLQQKQQAERKQQKQEVVTMEF